MRAFRCTGVWRENGQEASIVVYAANKEAAIAEANTRGVLVESATEIFFPTISNAVGSGPIAGFLGKILGGISLVIGAVLIFVGCAAEVSVGDYYNNGLLETRHLIVEAGFFTMLFGILDIGFISVVEAIKATKK